MELCATNQFWKLSCFTETDSNNRKDNIRKSCRLDLKNSKSLLCSTSTFSKQLYFILYVLSVPFQGPVTFTDVRLEAEATTELGHKEL